MANTRKDGLPAKHKGGRPTKSEELGLPSRLQAAYKFVSKNKVREGADEVLQLMWKTARDKDHPKQFDALKWLTERYYGKEPKAIVVQHNHEHKSDFNIQAAIAQAFAPKTIEIEHETIEHPEDQSDLQTDTGESEE